MIETDGQPACCVRLAARGRTLPRAGQTLWRPLVRLVLLLLALPAAPVTRAAVPSLLNNYMLKLWGPEEGLRGTGITKLRQTPDGFLWIASYDGLTRFDGMNFV